MKNAFVGEDHLHRIPAQKGYPVLQQRGKELIKQGVQLVDSTPIYRHEKQTVYRDWCCHVKELGYALVAKEIAKEILNGKSK